MSAVPSAKVLAPPEDLPSALREIDRLRAVQEKNAASAMAATRRAFDEQAQLEKKIKALELAAERATAEAREMGEKAEREAQEAKKSVKAAEESMLLQLDWPIRNLSAKYMWPLGMQGPPESARITPSQQVTSVV